MSNNKISYKDFLLALYVYYMLNHFKTRCYLHHPFEIWFQNKKILDYLKHPIESDDYTSKVCPLGNHVGKLLAIFLVGRYLVNKKTNQKLTRIIWTLVLTGSLLMNMNVFLYILPAYLIDSY